MIPINRFEEKLLPYFMLVKEEKIMRGNALTTYVLTLVKVYIYIQCIFEWVTTF